MKKNFLSASLILVSVSLFAFVPNKAQDDKRDKTTSSTTVLGKLDSIPVYKIGGNSNLTGSNNTVIDEKEYNIKVYNSQVTALYIDGEKIPAEKIINYKPILDKAFSSIINNREKSARNSEQSKRDSEQFKIDREQSRIDSEQSARNSEMWDRIFDELISDKLIKNRKELYSFRLNLKELKINGVVQPSNIHQKYKNKYFEVVPGEENVSLVYEVHR